MKRTLYFILAALVLLSALTGCSLKNVVGKPDAASVESIQTLGDGLALDEQDFHESAVFLGICIVGIHVDGVVYRAFADVPADVEEAIYAIDYSDPDSQKIYEDLISPLPVERVENLTEGIPAQEELDKLVGKTGGELLDDGWLSTGYMLDDMRFFFDHGVYSYEVVFDGQLEMSDDFDEYEAIRPLTVKSVVCTGVGDITYMEEEFQPELEEYVFSDEPET